MYMLYQEDEEEKGIDEMDQSMQDQYPSSLNDPYEYLEEQAKEEQPDMSKNPSRRSCKRD